MCVPMRREVISTANGLCPENTIGSLEDVYQHTIRRRTTGESEPPQSAAETIGENRADERLIGQSPVRFRAGRSPKTPRTRANFGANERNERPVSATRDYTAERVDSNPR
jgi:hypothetical protein